MNTILSFVGGLSFISISKKLCSRFLPLIYDRKTYLRYQNKPEKWILVTGASGGIGFSFCKKFAVLNYNLILIGRDEKKLIKVKQDLSQLNSQIKIDYFIKDFQIDLECLQINTPLEVIINCIGSTNVHRAQDQSKTQQIINSNIYSQTLTTQLALKQNTKYMINIGSMLGIHGFPYLSVYSATKAFNQKYFECIQNENIPNLRFLNVSPYYVSTKMTNFQKSFFTIEPDQLVDSIIKHFNYGSISAAGHYKHEIIDILYNFSYFRKRQFQFLDELITKIERIQKIKKK